VALNGIGILINAQSSGTPTCFLAKQLGLDQSFLELQYAAGDLIENNVDGLVTVSRL
jgi:hypothetical protein